MHVLLQRFWVYRQGNISPTPSRTSPSSFDACQPMILVSFFGHCEQPYYPKSVLLEVLGLDRGVDHLPYIPPQHLSNCQSLQPIIIILQTLLANIL